MKLKIKFGIYLGSLGDKTIGIVYSECYDSEILAFIFWNRGIIFINEFKEGEER